MGIEDERAGIKVCSSRGSSLDFGQFHRDVGLSILRAELGIDPDNHKSKIVASTMTSMCETVLPPQKVLNRLGLPMKKRRCITRE